MLRSSLFRLMPSALIAALALVNSGCRNVEEPKPLQKYGQTSYLPPLGPMPAAEIIDILNYDQFADPKRWAPAECEVKKSHLTVDNRPCVHMHIPVDYHAGEKQYPIGWPRMYLNLITGENDWSDYDRLEFKLYTEMSRKEPPTHALSMVFRSKDGQSTSIAMGKDNKMKLGEWVSVTMPISDIKSAGQISSIGLNISESNYKDKDVLDFHIGGFRLVRSTACTILEMTAKPAYLFSDSAVLTVELLVTGPASDAARGVPFELKHGDDNALRSETLPVKRGRNILNIDVSELDLIPNEYRLTAFPDNPERRIYVDIKVVDSPWRVDKIETGKEKAAKAASQKSEAIRAESRKEKAEAVKTEDTK